LSGPVAKGWVPQRAPYGGLKAQTWASKQHIGDGPCIGVWARHQKREVEAPKAPSKLIWTNTRVADRLGAFIAASRGKVGDVLRSVIYFWEPSLRAQ
jgi:hypothetical protein